ncbi:MAG: tryptophan-rich sensory protein [Chloroflexi bacterium]|nr:tryptophan-rich sensory protein [Chloroflexota bacterium]
MNKDIVRQIVNILAVLVTIAVNGLANALPLNGLNTGQISDRFHVYFVPAGYVFAIWGVIYVGFLAFAVYQALPSQRANPRLRRVGYWFALSCLANVVWIFLWHYELFPLTILAMLALLLCLIVIYLILGIGRTRVSAGETWLVRVPMSIYLGWITVATIANATSLLDYLNWNGFGLSPELWMVVMLVAATVIASAVALTRGDVAYMLVIVWAFVGIAVKHAGVSLVANPTWLMTAVVVVMLVVGAVLHWRKRDRIPLAQ